MVFSPRPIIQVCAGHMRITEELEFLLEDNSPSYRGVVKCSEGSDMPQISLMCGIERLTRRRSINEKNAR